MSEEPPALYTCANHPNRETSLRCNRCEKPICPQCAVLTPTGYRCKECVKGQQQIFNTAEWIDYPIAFIVAAVLSGIGSIFIGYVGFFVILLAPVVGVVIAEAVRLATRRHRSRSLYMTALVGTILGGCGQILFTVYINAVGLLVGGVSAMFGSTIIIAYYVIYLVLVGSSMYYRLSGIQLGRK
jgi:hypothetical protein